MSTSQDLQRYSDDDDKKNIAHSVTDIELITRTYLEKQNTGFEKLVAKFFPGQIEKAKKAFIRDAFLKAATKRLTLYEAQTAYEIELLKGALTIKLQEFGVESKKFINTVYVRKAVELEKELAPLEAELKTVYIKKYNDINKIEIEHLKKISLETWQKDVEVVYGGISKCKQRFAESVDQEINVYMQQANRK